MGKNVNLEASYDGEETLKTVKKLYLKARDMKMEYHSLNDEERQWITKWIFNLNRTFSKVLSIFILLVDIIAFICGYLDISDFNTYASVYLMIFSISSIFIWSNTFIFLPMRNKEILKRIDFDNVQECILSRIVTHYRGMKCYVILQWDAEKQMFYEVDYRYDLPKCYKGDIVYHPYGMKFYIPQKKF